MNRKKDKSEDDISGEISFRIVIKIRNSIYAIKR